MHKKIYKTVIFFFILLPVYFPQDSIASGQDKILVTDHFIINTELNNSSYAASFADKIENCHRAVASFIEYEPLEKINVTVVTGKNFITDISGIIKSRNYITISVDEHFNDPGNILYRKIFTEYLKQSMGNNNPDSVFDKEFYDSILNYSASDYKFIQTLIYDLVNNMELLPVNLLKIEKYTASQQEVIYTAFVDYIISAFGKKVFVQSVKDASYYHDIFTSVSMVSGVNAEELDTGFNKYLSGYKTDLPDMRLKKKVPDTADDEFNSISFSLSTDKIAVLQRNKDDYRILLKNINSSGIIELKHSEHGSVFNNIICISNNLVYVSEIIQTGSIIHIYNSTTETWINRFKLPYLYLTSVTTGDKDYLIFSASCGIYSDIYIINLNTAQLNIINRSGNSFYPVKIKNRIYCISVTEKYSIIEIADETGKEKELFSTGQKISDLCVMGEDYLIFVMEINGIKNIYRLNLHGGNFTQITNDNFFNHSPRYSDGYIYYLSYYKNKYRIFFTRDDHKQ